MGLPTAIAGGIQGAQALGSGIKGKQGANQAQQRQNQINQRVDDLFGQGQQAIGDMQNRADAMLTEGIDPTALANQAQQGGQSLQETLGGLAGQLQGNTPQMDFGAIPGQGQAGSAADALAGLGGPQFNFQQGQQTADQAMQNFRDFAGRARDTALEQGAQQFGAQSDALDAALAQRGMSRDSGVAGGAMADLAREQAQQTVGLERELANMAGEQGLQATQFDIQQGLQRDQIGSQFELGRAGQVASNLQGAGQLGLGIGQNALTGQGQEADFQLGQAGQVAQNLGMAGDMAAQGFQMPLQMQQQMFQQNQMAPYMQLQQMANPMQFIGPALQMMMGGQEISAEQNQNAGAGFGSALGGLTDTIAGSDMSGIKSNKNTGGSGSAPTMTTGAGTSLTGPMNFNPGFTR